MTPLTKLLAPSIAPLVARRDLVRESLRATDHDFDTTDLQTELRTLEADIARLEALAKATESETRGCAHCDFRASHVCALTGDDLTPAQRVNHMTAPEWCQLRTGPVLVMLRTS